MIKYLFTNNYEYERYQDTCQDRWDNGGSEELGEIDFTNAEELMQYIMEYKYIKAQKINNIFHTDIKCKIVIYFWNQFDIFISTSALHKDLLYQYLLIKLFIHK